MSRTKKSGSTAHRSTSVSSSAGSGAEPAAIAAWSRTDAASAPRAAATRVGCGVPLVGLIETTSSTQGTPCHDVWVKPPPPLPSPGGRDQVLRPHRLARAVAPRTPAPAGGQPRHQEQPPAPHVLRPRRPRLHPFGRGPVAPRVGDLDPHGAGAPGHLHPEVEVPAAHMTVSHGVGGQLADD